MAGRPKTEMDKDVIIKLFHKGHDYIEIVVLSSNLLWSTVLRRP